MRGLEPHAGRHDTPVIGAQKMGWAFEVTCPDCGYEWGGINATCIILHRQHEEVQSLFCPHCATSVRLPVNIDRKTWTRYCDQLAESLRRQRASWANCGMVVESFFLEELVETITPQFKNTPWQLPTPISLATVRCPHCRKAMDHYVGDVDFQLECPQCHGRSTVLGGISVHCSVLYEPHMFGFM